MIVDLDEIAVVPSSRGLRNPLGPLARVGRWLGSAWASRQARLMLNAVVSRPKARGAPAIPPHLLRDIGLSPDHGASSSKWWDHQ